LATNIFENEADGSKMSNSSSCGHHHDRISSEVEKWSVMSENHLKHPKNKRGGANAPAREFSAQLAL
jgi:hypothetical protein